jgi:lysophospholipase L1-like esterase
MRTLDAPNQSCSQSHCTSDRNAARQNCVMSIRAVNRFVCNPPSLNPRSRIGLATRREIPFTGIMPAKTPISIRKKVCFSCTVLIFVFGILELACRALGVGATPEIADYVSNWKAQWDGEFYLVAPQQGWGINGDGVRDYQHRVENPEGRLRIVCLGDSVTMGFRLEYDDSYPAILETQLNEKGMAAEVFNVALPGWSTRQQRIAYNAVVRKYKPDILILGLCLNDIAEMQNNTLTEPSDLMRLMQRSNLMRGLLQAESREIARVEELFETPNASHVVRGWETSLNEIANLAVAVERDGCQFVLLVFPFKFQVIPNAPEPHAQRRLQRFSDRHDIPLVDVLPELTEAGPSSFMDHDHLTRIGTKIVAEAIINRDLIARKSVTKASREATSPMD